MDSIRSRRTWAIGPKYARSDARVPLSVVNLQCFKLSSWTLPALRPAWIVAWAGFPRRFQRRLLATVVIKNSLLKSMCCGELDCRERSAGDCDIRRDTDRITIQRRPREQGGRRILHGKFFARRSKVLRWSLRHGWVAAAVCAPLPWTFFDRIVKWS